MRDKLDPNVRKDWIDIVKFWGMLAIVWGHTLSSGNVRHYLYSFHVPLFFFVIGLFFAPPKQSFWKFTAKKAKALLIPFFSFAIISILIFFVLGNLAATALEEDISGNSLPANLVEMLTGQCRANRPLWFLPSMFCCYILCFLITRILGNRNIFVKRIAALGIAVISLVLCFLNEEIYHIDALFFKVDVAVFMLAFVAVAYLLKPLFSKRLAPALGVLLAMLLLAAGGIAAFANSQVEYLNNQYGNVFLFFTSSLLTIVGFCILSIVMTQSNIKMLTAPFVYVGKRTLPILLMHKFPILFFQVIFPWTKEPMKANDPFVGLVVAIISIAGCLVVDVLLRKIVAILPTRKHKTEHSNKTAP